MVPLPEWDCVSLNGELCSGLHKYRDAFWPRRSRAAYVLRIPSACSSSCRLCCTCERSQSRGVNILGAAAPQHPRDPAGNGGASN